MSVASDLSHRCLVLTADPSLWWSHFRGGVGMACLDGDNLAPLRADSSDVEEMATPELLDLLEFGAVVVADLVRMSPAVWSLVSWLARARPESVLLVRHGSAPLPFELHEFAVRSLDVEDPSRAIDTRIGLAERVVVAAKRRRHAEPGGADLTSPFGNPAAQRRRARSGVRAELASAAEALLAEDMHEASEAMLRALAIEPSGADLLLRLALLHRRAGRWVDAGLALERAAEVAPGYAPVWRELGIVREHAGSPGALRALRRAVDLSGDFEACVTLGLLLARRGDMAEADQLFDRAMRASGGQLNLVLPALIGRARQRRRININPFERGRLEEVLSIRRAQAAQTPPTDAPWSFFDAARACLLLGQEEEALALVEASVPHITAWWQRDTFGQGLAALEAAGVDGAPFRECLGIAAAAPAAESPGAAAEPEEVSTPPFQAEARPPEWYPDNVPCMSACPVGTDAGSYVHLLAEGRFEDAYDVARGPNPFASVCGRVCAAPCEDACRRGNIDQPVEIRSLKRFLTENHGVESSASRVEGVLDGTPAPCIEGEAYTSHLAKLGHASEPRRVAVIGGGPAGMACAHDLALLGHKVTVFEAAHQLGGMMRQGIPVYRLPRDLLDREMGVILGLGVEVRLGTPLTAERTLASLLESEFDAAFLGTGAGKGRDLEVEGSDLDGVVRAIDFLLNVNEGYRIELGPQVVVVGGGNVALDVARTARLGRPPDKVWRKESREASQATFGPALEGRAFRDAIEGRAREVHVLARQPMGQWPAQRSVRGAEELEQAQREGVVFHPLRGLRRITGENGRVTGVELAEVVQLTDASGRYAPVYGAHTADRFACDAVVLAVGQTPDLDYLGAEVNRTRRGLIEVDAESLATSMPGVYAGGDAAFGPRTLIEGVSDGKRAARHIHDWLSGSRGLKATYRFEELHPRSVPTAEDYDKLERASPPSLGIDRRTGIAEVEMGYDEPEAVRQASRCLVCHVQTVYNGDLCIACGRCTEVCPYSCLSFADPEEVGGLDPDLREALEGQPAAVYMVKDEDRCVRCGLCAERCPTGAMTMEQFEATVVGT